jgi:hypothetical protein
LPPSFVSASLPGQEAALFRQSHHSGHRRDADTTFDSSAKEDLKVWRDVQMVGVDLRNGTTMATRVVVYEGDRPVRMWNVKVMPVTGRAK